MDMRMRIVMMMSIDIGHGVGFCILYNESGCIIILMRCWKMIMIDIIYRSCW